VKDKHINAIRIENLSYTYPPVAAGASPTPALRDIHLAVKAGEFLAVLGPTGAGKTTLCLALNGLVPHSTGGAFRGDVWVAGRNTKTQPVAELATQVGVVFQDSESQLFNMTVEDEVAFGPESLGLPVEEIERRAAWALDAVGLADLRARSPAHLSGGQQRRLAIASVLAMQPGILVLDEPVAGLDPAMRRAVLDVVAELRRRGSTVVMATQDADAAAGLADRVIVLDAGRIVMEGTPQQVLGGVAGLHALGIDTSQMAELSQCLGLQPACLTVDQAVAALSGDGRGWSWDVGLAPSLAGWEQRTQPERPTGPAVPAVSPDLSRFKCPAIAFENVWYRYEAGAQALAGVELGVDAGEVVALIGANGSGKTTLAKHVNGLLRPQQGHVRVAGRDTRRQSTGELARRVGYVFQNPDHQLFAPTLWEEIAFGPRNLGLDRAEVKRRVEAAQAVFDLAPLAGLPPATLGYGQRRLATLAAVHAMQPEVLILDEPTLGLDRRLTARLVEWMLELGRAGASVVLITHDMRLAGAAARWVVMRQGQVALDAPAAEIFTHAGRLGEAGIAAPPIVELSRRLGLPAAPPTIEDFCRVFSRRFKEVNAP
jgi:energy-coupling factor transport system ATP-binding protein